MSYDDMQVVFADSGKTLHTRTDSTAAVDTQACTVILTAVSKLQTHQIQTQIYTGSRTPETSLTGTGYKGVTVGGDRL